MAMTGAERSRKYREAHPGRAAQNARRWRRAHPQKNKEAKRKRDLKTYGLSLGDYARLLEEQDGKCAICGTSNPEGPGGIFHVDHDHGKKKVRGLLCSRCNTMLGFAKDDITTLAAAIRYLNRKE